MFEDFVQVPVPIALTDVVGAALDGTIKTDFEITSPESVSTAIVVTPSF